MLTVKNNRKINPEKTALSNCFVCLYCCFLKLTKNVSKSDSNCLVVSTNGYVNKCPDWNEKKKKNEPELKRVGSKYHSKKALLRK